jgi:hypothetical protein
MHRPKVPEAELDADEQALERAIQDPQLISGIHNYCDRWCERCPLTARCLVFKMERSRAARRGDQPSDLANAEFWDDIARNFALALRLVSRGAEKFGLPPGLPEVTPADLGAERVRRQTARLLGRTLHRAAAACRRSARALLDRLPKELTETEEALNTLVRLGAGDPHAVAAAIGDALEVVQWYLYLIEVKLQRAISSRVDDQQERDEGYPSDADGSAKVALIAIDRSMGAWGRLRGHLPAEADAILDQLVQLERLRRRVKREFPMARAFMRPGFDAKEGAAGSE